MISYETQYDTINDNVSSISVLLEQIIAHDENLWNDTNDTDNLLSEQLSTPTTADEDYGISFRQILVFIFFVLIILYATVGNILVCLAIFTDRHLRKLSNLFLASLAVADLLVSMFVMSLAAVNDLLGYWPIGATTCSIWMAADITCSTCSILNLCAISLDRYINIKWPLQYSDLMNRTKVGILLALIWMISILLSTIPLSVGWHRTENSVDLHVAFQNTSHPKCALEMNPYYSITSSCISFFLPCALMVVIYVRLYLIARKQVEAMKKTMQMTKKFTARTTPNAYKMSRKQYRYRLSNYKALITLGIIMSVFLLCWTPFFVCNVIISLCNTCVGETLFTTTVWAGYLNSACNPIIYSIFNVQFRTAFKKIICKYFCGKTVHPAVSFDISTYSTGPRGRASSEEQNLTTYPNSECSIADNRELWMKYMLAT